MDPILLISNAPSRFYSSKSHTFQMSLPPFFWLPEFIKRQHRHSLDQEERHPVDWYIHHTGALLVKAIYTWAISPASISCCDVYLLDGTCTSKLFNTLEEMAWEAWTLRNLLFKKEEPASNHPKLLDAGVMLTNNIDFPPIKECCIQVLKSSQL